MKYFFVSGNCSTGIISKALAILLPNFNFEPLILPSIDDKVKSTSLLKKLQQAGNKKELIWISSGRFDLINNLDIKTIKIPNIFFDAFHPDLTYVKNIKTNDFFYPHYNSQIVIWCYNNEVNLANIEMLFNSKVFKELGYNDLWGQSLLNLKKIFMECEFSEDEFDNFFFKIKKLNNFMYSINHPRNEVLFEFAKLIALKIDKNFDIKKNFTFFEYPSLENKSWAFYPDLAYEYGLQGNYFWRFDDIVINDLKSYIIFACNSFKKNKIYPGELKPMKFIDKLDFILSNELKML